VRALSVVLAFLLSQSAALASYSWSDSAGDYKTITSTLNCSEVGDRLAQAYSSAGYNTGSLPVIWWVEACSGSVEATGQAYSITFAHSTNGTTPTVVTVSEILQTIVVDTGVFDPTAFGGWFAATFMMTGIFYFAAVGVGMIIDLVRRS
jgi:hypothetical protein